MNCPRCKAEIAPLSNPDAIVTCPGCGSRLMTRAAALRSGGSVAQPPAPPTPPVLPADPPKPGSDTSPGLSPQKTAVKVGQTTLSGKSTGGAVRSGGRKSSASPEVTLEMLLREIQAVRETQQAILAALAGLAGRSAEPFATPAVKCVC